MKLKCSVWASEKPLDLLSRVGTVEGMGRNPIQRQAISSGHGTLSKRPHWAARFAINQDTQGTAKEFPNNEHRTVLDNLD